MKHPILTILSVLLFNHLTYAQYLIIKEIIPPPSSSTKDAGRYKVTYLIKNHLLRVENNSSYAIFDSNKGTVYVVSKNSKEYTVIPRSFKAVLQSPIFDLKKWQTMKESMRFREIKWNIEEEKLYKGKKVQVYNVKLSNNYIKIGIESWIDRSLSHLNIINKYRVKLASFNPSGDEWLDFIKKAEGIPVRELTTFTTPTGSASMEERIEEIKNLYDIPLKMFELPKGYKYIEFNPLNPKIIPPS